MGESKQVEEIQMGQADPNQDTTNGDPKHPQLPDEKQDPASKTKHPQLPDEKQDPASKTKFPKFAETFRNGLDDVVHVNTLFGSAVFIGLSFSYMTKTLETREECKPGNEISKWLLVFEVIAFGFFILSTLLGKAMKIHLYITTKEPGIVQIACRVMMIMCAISTLLGSVFLYLSLINVLQLRLGKLSCTGDVWIGAGALSFLYLIALLSWIPSVVYALKLAWDQEF